MLHSKYHSIEEVSVGGFCSPSSFWLVWRHVTATSCPDAHELFAALVPPPPPPPPPLFLQPQAGSSKRTEERLRVCVFLCSRACTGKERGWTLCLLCCFARGGLGPRTPFRACLGSRQSTTRAAASPLYALVAFRDANLSHSCLGYQTDGVLLLLPRPTSPSCLQKKC